jgi:hypothetical protein
MLTGKKKNRDQGNAPVFLFAILEVVASGNGLRIQNLLALKEGRVTRRLAANFQMNLLGQVLLVEFLLFVVQDTRDLFDLFHRAQ